MALKGLLAAFVVVDAVVIDTAGVLAVDSKMHIHSNIGGKISHMTSTIMSQSVYLLWLGAKLVTL